MVDSYIIIVYNSLWHVQNVNKNQKIVKKRKWKSNPWLNQWKKV